MDLIQQGSVDEGVESLLEAYEILPHPNVLYNIARAYAEANRYEEALDYFDRYLAADPPDRDEVQGFVTALQDRIAAQAAPQAATAEAGPADAGAGEGAPEVSSEEIDAIEASAQQIETLAAATQSEALHQRAERLRQLAVSLRNRTAAASAAGGAGGEDGAGGEGGAGEGGEGGEGGQGGAGGEGGEGGGGLAFGEGPSEDLYEERVVSASRFAESPLDAPNSTTTVTAQDIRLSGLTNIADVLRRAAGVEVMSHSPAHTDISIRGLNTRQSNKVLVLIDGRSMRLDFLGAPFWSLLPVALEDIERIEIIRGPASAVYGADAVSGVVNIITREPGEGRSQITMGAGNNHAIHASGSATGRAGSLRYRFSGGYDTSDAFSVEVGPDRADLETFAADPGTGYNRQFFSGEGRVAFGEGWGVNFGSSISAGGGDIQGLSRLRQMRIKHSVLQQSHATISSPVGVFLRSYWNHFGTDVDTAEFPPDGIRAEGSVRMEVVDTELGFARQFDLGVPHNFSAGLGYRFKGVEWDWLTDDQTENHYFGYLQDILQLHERLRLTLSFRIDKHPLLDGIQASPRGALVWRVAEGQSLRVTAGSAFRSPNFAESYVAFENRTPFRGATALGVGDQNLDGERMISMEVGYANQATDYFAAEVNAYFNLFDDLILLSDYATFNLADFGRGYEERQGQPDIGVGYYDSVQAFPIGTLTFANDDTTFFQWGGEAGVRVFPVTGLDVYANYAYHETQPRNAQSIELARRQERRTSQHKVNAGVQYRSRFGLDVAVDLHWVSDQIWTEQVTDTATGVRFENFPLDGYVLLNARVGWRLLDDQLEFGLAGTNLTFQEHRQHPFGQLVDTRVLATGTFRF